MAVEPMVEELMAQVAKRDTQALGDLYDRFAPSLLGMLESILPARNIAEEALEDVFLRLWSQARALHQEGPSLSAWLVMTARQVALSRLRDGGKARPQAVRGGKPRKPASDKPLAPKSGRAISRDPIPLLWFPRPEEIALVDERSDLLRKVVNQLPKPQLQALDLAVFKGLTEEEIALQLGEPLGKVRTALRAAVTFLRHRSRAVLGTWSANI